MAVDSATKIAFAALPLIVCAECGEVVTEDSQAKHEAWHRQEREG